MNKRIFFSLASLFLALGLSSQNLVNVRVAEGTLAGTDSSGVKIATTGSSLAGCEKGDAVRS